MGPEPIIIGGLILSVGICLVRTLVNAFRRNWTVVIGITSGGAVGVLPWRLDLGPGVWLPLVVLTGAGAALVFTSALVRRKKFAAVGSGVLLSSLVVVLVSDLLDLDLPSITGSSAILFFLAGVLIAPVWSAAGTVALLALIAYRQTPNTV